MLMTFFVILVLGILVSTSIFEKSLFGNDRGLVPVIVPTVAISFAAGVAFWDFVQTFMATLMVVTAAIGAFLLWTRH